MMAVVFLFLLINLQIKQKSCSKVGSSFWWIWLIKRSHIDLCDMIFWMENVNEWKNLEFCFKTIHFFGKKIILSPKFHTFRCYFLVASWTIFDFWIIERAKKTKTGLKTCIWNWTRQFLEHIKLINAWKHKASLECNHFSVPRIWWLLFYFA